MRAREIERAGEREEKEQGRQSGRESVWERE